jgi:hypothetical protein
VLKAACFRAEFRNDLSMSSSSVKPNGPVTLNEEQIMALHGELRKMRHDVNGRLANIAAAAELMRLRPESSAERLQLLLEQPHKAAESIGEFSRQFEQMLGLFRA